ncbi:MAG: hypothetical protein LUG13_09605 [Oscillospiraceae bacterium]|nr:hypothetical protein [Oscillospiraceae bacterium]
MDANHLWIDVGNTIQAGALDVNGTVYASTAQVLLAHAHLIAPFAAMEQVTIVTHIRPDADACISAFFARYYFEHGVFPPKAEQMQAFAGDVNRGRIRLNVKTARTFYNLVCFLPEVYRGHGKPQSEINRLVLQEMDAVLEAYACGEDTIDLMEDEIVRQGYKEVAALARRDYQTFLQEVQGTDMQACEATLVHLPERDTGKIAKQPVKALFWRRPSRCVHNRLWARMHGYVLTCAQLGGDGRAGSGAYLYGFERDAIHTGGRGA